MKIQNRQQWLGVLAGAAIALFVTDRLILTPLSTSWKVRRERIETLGKQVANGRNLVQREAGLRLRWQQMVTNTLPADVSQAQQELLSAFDRWSRESGVTLMSISPQLKHDSDDYMTVECRVEANGTLNTLSQFLYSLERGSMALKLQSVEFTSHDNDGLQLALGLQVSGLILTPSQK